MNFLEKLLGKNSTAVEKEPQPPKIAPPAENLELENKNVIENSLLFDAEWYCKNYGFGKYLDAATHYLNIGWRENKNPSPFFSTADYLEQNPDVEIAGRFCILKSTE